MAAQSFMRSGQPRGGFAVLAALALCLKALLPTGYMIAVVDGEARLIICPAGVHQPSTMHHEAGAMDMTHAQHVVQHAAADCPFALAAAAAHATAAVESAEPYFVLLPNAAPPLRHRAPRGPPSLA
jgi:hypothetical protein